MSGSGGREASGFSAGAGRGRPGRQGIKHHIRSRLLAGLVVIFPVGFTLWILYILFRFLDGLLRPLIDPWLRFTVPGLGLIAVVVLLYLVGLLAANVLGRQILLVAESLVVRIPLVRAIYLASKQIIETLRMPHKGAFQRVVLVEYPRRGVWALAFITGQARRMADGAVLLHIFLPTSPNPTSGMMLILRDTEVVDLDLSVEDGIRLVVSGGILSPQSYPLTPRARFEAEAPGVAAAARRPGPLEGRDV
ncbi:MAG: DUF502 domain-containing protein [Acidobacteriota bacterium]